MSAGGNQADADGGRGAVPVALCLTDLLGLDPKRAAFEAWAKDQGFPLERLDTFGCEMDYRDVRTHTAWEGFCVGVAAERERWRLLLARIDVSISGCIADAVTARSWAHDMGAVQQMLRDELRA